MSDGLFKVGIQQTVELQSQTTTTPIYFYYYEYPASFGLEEAISSQPKNWGVSHGDDVLTIFDNRVRKAPHGLPYEERELLIQKQLIDFYESFSNNKYVIFYRTNYTLITFNFNFSYTEFQYLVTQN